MQLSRRHPCGRLASGEKKDVVRTPGSPPAPGSPFAPRPSEGSWPGGDRRAPLCIARIRGRLPGTCSQPEPRTYLCKPPPRSPSAAGGQLVRQRQTPKFADFGGPGVCAGKGPGALHPGDGLLGWGDASHYRAHLADACGGLLSSKERKTAGDSVPRGFVADQNPEPRVHLYWGLLGRPPREGGFRRPRGAPPPKPRLPSPHHPRLSLRSPPCG